LAGRISRDGVSVHVRPQLMDLAVAFAARQGRVVSREELFASVWPQLFVAESALARCVAELRRLLGDSARSPRIIETIPKRGYRLVAPVVPVACMAQILRDRASQPPTACPLREDRTGFARVRRIRRCAFRRGAGGSRLRVGRSPCP